MSIGQDLELIEKFKELQSVGSAKVTIFHDQVNELVVADLMAKYKACRIRGDDFESAFRKVLTFYLTEDEMKEMDGL